MRKIVMLKPDVNANALRNQADGKKPELSHFVRHIEGKPLKVAYELKNEACVQDEEGEFWELKRADLIPQSQFATVGQELTQGRSLS